MREQDERLAEELAERVGAWLTERRRERDLGRALEHSHWCQGDEESPAHGWSHQGIECWGEEPTLRSTSLTCPECFSRPELEVEWREPRGLGVPRD